LASEFAARDRLPIDRVVARHPDAVALGKFGLEHPATVLLLYGRDTAGPVGRVGLGNTAADGRDRYALIRESDLLALVPGDAAQHLAVLLQLAGTPS
jgi:hypothetical protein